MKEHPRVSIVIPVFNEEENIAALAGALSETLVETLTKTLLRAPITEFSAAGNGRQADGGYELIFVDDGSEDRSLELLRGLERDDPRIRYISFSRNFGHQAALRAGMEAADGDCVVMMDGDFQHPPALLPAMLAEFEKGFDIVATKRLEVKSGSPGETPYAKRLTSRLFYALANALSDTKIEPGTADFRLLSRRAKDVILSMKEHNLFFRGAIPWTGLPSTEIAFTPERRKSGKSKYTLSKMFSLALDGITSFSVRPLRLTSFAGIAISAAGFLYAIYALLIRLFTDRTVEGWTSILISVLIIGGIQLLSLGIIGEYLGKLFMETKGRPHYIVKEASPPRGAEASGGRP
ncbi:MAG TPA: glycosyltransferase family 2 protein [Rectinemataceae bacterium]|nr:glycosyltransferase family 2 protein [Rectinemataceae bacterium]